MRRLRSWSVVTALLLALVACTDDPRTPQYWEKRLSRAKQVREKTHTLSELRDSGYLAAPMVPMLNASLGREKSFEVRGEIARMLQVLKDRSSVEPLIEAIDWGETDRSGHAMNKEIAAALAQIADERASPALLRLLRSRDPYTRIEAVNGLGMVRAKEAVGPLIQIVGDETAEPFLVKKAIVALGNIGDAKAVPSLIKMLFKERRGMSFYPESSFALFQIGRPASEALLAVIRNENPSLLAWAKQNDVLMPAVYSKSAQILGDLNELRAVTPLLKQLNFQSEYLDLKLLVRMRAADALGRLKAQEAVKPLLAAIDESEEPAAVREYVTALARIGAREAIPGMAKVVATTDWETREQGIRCLAMLGDEREQPQFEKFIGSENSLTTSECNGDPSIPGCREPAQLAKGRIGAIQRYQKVVAAAGQCKSDPACWLGKVNDPEPLIRERSALEVGRSHQSARVDELSKRLGEKDLGARAAIILAINWLIEDKEAAARARSSLGSIEEQLSIDKGKLEFVKVNEELQRLAVRLRQSAVRAP